LPGLDSLSQGALLVVFHADRWDGLLYFTDGVTEAVGFSGERFEEHRLINQFQTACHGDLGAQEILDLFFARLDRFAGADRQLDDDAALVVLKVGDQPVLPSLPS